MGRPTRWIHSQAVVRGCAEDVATRETKIYKTCVRFSVSWIETSSAFDAMLPT